MGSTIWRRTVVSSPWGLPPKRHALSPQASSVGGTSGDGSIIPKRRRSICSSTTVGPTAAAATNSNWRCCNWPPKPIGSGRFRTTRRIARSGTPSSIGSSPHVTRAIQGVYLDSAETLRDMIERKVSTTTGLTSRAYIMDREFTNGQKTIEVVPDEYPIVRKDVLPKWNYTCYPSNLYSKLT